MGRTEVRKHGQTKSHFEWGAPTKNNFPLLPFLTSYSYKVNFPLYDRVRVLIFQAICIQGDNVPIQAKTDCGLCVKPKDEIVNQPLIWLILLLLLLFNLMINFNVKDNVGQCAKDETFLTVRIHSMIDHFIIANLE